MDELLQKIQADPYANLLAITIEKLDKGYALCSVTITEDMLNFVGLVHGGLVFSLADVSFSAASNSDYHPSYALDVSGSFLRSASVGDRLTSEASLVHTTRRTGVYRMDVKKNGELIATFNGTVFRKM
ncbi:MAG TPA: hotdog fold thioesterase [Spirochaetota bacterium]|nr:hotdog fold thioesterase [Spirochaetota bacterium]HPI91185.1 hotdog fold thioesterase [Spirochaetota bacterium]HPR49473.1 hotdog fold thioesterase [Spirochaetota bacterium]